MRNQISNIAWLVMIFALAITLLLLSGCQSVHPAATSVTGDAIARIDARAQGIGDNAKRLEPLTNDAGKPLVGAISQSATLIRTDAADAQKANAQAAADYAALNERYLTLNARWYVWLGRRIEWVAAIAAGVWTLMGVAGVSLLAFFPGAALGGIGKQLLNFLPFSTPFTILANWIKGRQANTVTVNIQTGQVK